MPKVDVNAKRGYEASVPIERYWDKFGNDLEKSFHIPIGENKEKEDKSIDLKRNGHILAGGEALSGVGMFRRVVLATLLKFNRPEDLQLILIDPLKISFFYFKNIEKYLQFSKVIKENEEAVAALKWAVDEMERRNKMLLDNCVRNVNEYNKKNPLKKIPRIVIMITELGELMDFNKRDTEESILRIAQMARAVGIHLIITTQRTVSEVITPILSANIPEKIAFKTSDELGSFMILGTEGAEKLLGQGDLLLNISDSNKAERMQGYCLEEEEVEKLVFK